MAEPRERESWAKRLRTIVREEDSTTRLVLPPWRCRSHKLLRTHQHSARRIRLMMLREVQPSNPRLQRTRFRAPLSRKPLGHLAMATLNSQKRVAALVVAALVGLIGLFTGWQYLIESDSLSGSPSWGRVVVATLPPISGATVLVLVALAVLRTNQKRALPSFTRTRWALFALSVALGYLIVRDGLSYSLYLSRPGGLPGGCYTDLEVWFRVPHQDSWVRSLEQAVGCALFFAAPLFLLLERRRSSQSSPAVGVEAHGA
jgi:hypothetical protein